MIIPFHCFLRCACQRDYSAACPLGFSPRDGPCLADSALYAGPCSEFAFAANLGVEEAKKMELACDTSYPCASASYSFLSAAAVKFPMLNVHVQDSENQDEFSRSIGNLRGQMQVTEDGLF